MARRKRASELWAALRKATAEQQRGVPRDEESLSRVLDQNPGRLEARLLRGSLEV